MLLLMLLCMYKDVQLQQSLYIPKDNHRRPIFINAIAAFLYSSQQVNVFFPLIQWSGEMKWGTRQFSEQLRTESSLHHFELSPYKDPTVLENEISLSFLDTQHLSHLSLLPSFLNKPFPFTIIGINISAFLSHFTSLSPSARLQLFIESNGRWGVGSVGVITHRHLGDTTDQPTLLTICSDPWTTAGRGSTKDSEHAVFWTESQHQDKTSALRAPL